MSLSVKQKNIIVTIAVPLTLLACFIGWATWVGDTKDIESVADQFKVDSSWKLESSVANPPSTLCIDSKCPYVYRTWSPKNPITNTEEFQKIATIGGQKMKLLDDCFYISTSPGEGPSNSCDASIVFKGYQIWLHYYGSDPPGEISLEVEGAH